MEFRPLLITFFILQVCLVSVPDINISAAETVAYTKEQVHGSKQDCRICHISHRMKGTSLIKKPVSELCLECHPDSKAPSEHVVDVVPSMEVKELLLVKGKMTCVTCHDSHKHTHEYMLRTKPENLCQNCHKY